MPCLDATALATDPDGLEFLRAVLDTPVGTRPPAHPFDLVAPDALSAPALPLRELDVTAPLAGFRPSLAEFA